MLFFMFLHLIEMNKDQFRTFYQQKRNALDEEAIISQSIAIANNTLTLPIWDKNYFHLFLSIITKNEIDTQPLLHILNGRDKTVIVPKTNFKEGTLKHILLLENTKIKLNPYNIPEPEEGIEVPLNKIEVVFVPLLAFDLMGNRIGYGKGFYDRFLINCPSNCIKIGLSFFEAEVMLPSQNNDIPLHFCVTPNKTYKF